MKLIADNACCNKSLKSSAVAVAIFWILSTLVIPVFLPKSEWYVGLPIIIVNAALLIGALKNISWLLLPWLVHAVLAFIFFIIGYYAVVFIGGGTVQYLIITFIVYTIIFALFLYCTRIVYSLYRHLRESSSFPIPIAANEF